MSLTINKSSITNFFKRNILWPALVDTFIIVVFTIQPTIYVVINYWRKGETANLNNTMLSGDILLYSISFLSGSYLVYNQLRLKESDWKDNLNKFIIACIIVISMIYVMMKGDKETSLNFARWVSLSCLIGSLSIFFISQYLFRKPTTDVAEVRRDEQTVIEDSLS